MSAALNTQGGDVSTLRMMEQAHEQATNLLNNLLDLGLPILAPQAQFIRENLGSLIDEEYRIATAAMVTAVQGGE